MAVKILILELDVIYERIDNLHDFWRGLILYLTMAQYSSLVELYHKYPDYLKKISPYLYSSAPTLEFIILTIEDEEEQKQELRKIDELTRGEKNKLLDNLEEIIINSYENLIYDITGSDEIREIYRREVVEPIMTELENFIGVFGWESWLNKILFESTTEWFKELEKLVMGGISFGSKNLDTGT